MKIQYDPDFLKKLKKLNIRTRKSLRKQIELFIKNPFDLQLRNHSLKEPYLGYRSINITADYRAFYQLLDEEESIAYFSEIGTHKQLYKKKRK